MRRVILLFGKFLLFAICAHAQIEGDVVDQKGKGIRDVVVTATELGGKFIDTVKTDQRGFYSFSGLKPGKYKIEAKGPGFLPSVFKEIIVNEGDTGPVEGEEDFYKGTRLDITLTPSKVPK